MNTLNVSICSRDASALNQALIQHKHLNLVQVATDPIKINADKVEVLVADPDLAVKLVPHCQHLRWMQSTWAGNAPLMGLEKRDFVLTVARGIFDIQMREYVFAYLLQYVRKVSAMQALSALENPPWQTVLPNTLSGTILGIAGAGSIADSLIPISDAFDMEVIGLNRQGTPRAGYAQMYPSTNKLQFAAKCDAVLGLLPDTPHTHHFFDTAFFSCMRKDSLFINAGRGNAVDDDALLNSLKHSQPAHAVLDVFKQEPLPSDHAFWQHPQVSVTHHTAAMTAPTDIADMFAQNASHYLAGQPLQGLFDWHNGY